MNVRIKEGSHIAQDLSVFIWPACKPPEKEYKIANKRYQCRTLFADAVFQATYDEVLRMWLCRRDGYGAPECFGYGPITVRDFGSVTII